jgi:phosphoribosylaminoimidazolecarboxamide formyltransferase/IMP cyclohydrolase
MPKIRRALISVYDKTGIVEFARVLKEFNVDIISTGGTARHLNDNGISTHGISDITHFPEILNGRVKTLHPNIFGGVLALRDDSAQMKELAQHGIAPIDLVVVNLYPFEATIAKPDVSFASALENIDIGGPALIRAAAKNFLSVAVVTSPNQYEKIISELRERGGEIWLETRKRLASSAFARTAQYDHVIQDYLSGDAAALPEQVLLYLEKKQDLRYGENPHQRAALYRERQPEAQGLMKARQLHGKELSFNNLLDLNAALGLVQEFEEPCAVIIKHTNPCGAAMAANLREAYLRAKATDPVSAFGGIVGVNRPLDGETARAIAELFTEAIITPGFSDEALQILQSKKNLRLLASSDINSRDRNYDIKKIQGGYLLQDQDLLNLNDKNWKVVSQRQPSAEEWQAMKFAWRVAKWVKSNAIVFASSERTLGIGAGQMSRVDSCKLAIEKAGRFEVALAGSAVASDAFFPFRDGVDVVAEAGASAVIQPGGSVRDDEVIRAANDHHLAMVFTSQRHFRH